jgi:hypothetical protein
VHRQRYKQFINFETNPLLHPYFAFVLSYFKHYILLTTHLTHTNAFIHTLHTLMHSCIYCLNTCLHSYVRTCTAYILRTCMPTYLTYIHTLKTYITYINILAIYMACMHTYATYTYMHSICTCIYICITYITLHITPTHNTYSLHNACVHWTGHGCETPVFWPSRSPDLNLPDSLCGMFRN